MREAEIVLHDVHALTDRLRGFFGGHAAEIPHLDGARGGWMLVRERIDRRVEVEERNQSLGAIQRNRERIVNRYALKVAAAFVGLPGAGVIDQDVPHRFRRERQEMRPVRKLCLRSAEDPEVRLVDERGRLQRMVPALALQVAPGHAMQFRIDDRQELVGRTSVAGTGAAEQLRDPVGLHAKSLDDRSPNVPADSAFTDKGQRPWTGGYCVASSFLCYRTREPRVDLCSPHGVGKQFSSRRFHDIHIG